MLRIGTHNLFDGRNWLGPACVVIEQSTVVAIDAWDGSSPTDHRCHVLFPGLVDSGALSEGYLEGPTRGLPFRPEEAFALLCLLAGVTTVIDMGAGSNATAYLRGRWRDGAGPNICTVGARLVVKPTQRTDRAIDAETVTQTIQSLRCLGSELIRVGSLDEGLLAQVLATARDQELIVVRPLHPDQDSPGLIAHVPDGTSWLIPQLEAHEVWHVSGMLRTVDAARAGAFLPYARHFQTGQGMVGRLIAKDILMKLYGDRSIIEAPRAEASAALTGQRCVAASGSGGVALVPGISLWRDLGRLGPVDQVLSAATSLPGQLWGLHAGTVVPGEPADLVLAEAIASPSDATAWYSAVTAVVVNGHVRTSRELESQLATLVNMQEEFIL